MNLSIEKTDLYHIDVTRRFEWYFDKAGEEIAWRFFQATDETLLALARQPDLGWRRKFRNPLLHDLNSLQVIKPFKSILIFYRVTGDTLQAWRLMHGARDLPRRLAEPPA